MKKEPTFEEIIQSECGQCFGGYGSDCACKKCSIAKRCAELTKELDKN